ncbi:MAG: hypothetical protein RL325_1592 [Planctomycetota bacterium]|jgi:hypothetical protein
MISHNCSACGKPMGPASRTYSRVLAMWVARCERCGFATRWSPRRARAPFRAWLRLRGLNTRLGIAIGTGHAAGGFMFSTATLIVLRRVEASMALRGASLPSSSFLEECAILGAIAACCGAASAAAFPRHSGLLARWALAWIVCALPIVCAVLAASLAADGERVWYMIDATLRSRAGGLLVFLIVTIPLASLLLAAVASPVVAWGERLARLRFYAKQRFHLGAGRTEGTAWNL